MNKLKYGGLAIIMAMVNLFTYAQDKIVTDDNNVMKSNGKIYVVMTVVIVIVAGLLWYLIILDKKVSRLEKSMRS
jgi:prolipoprotein diacylglyceryltransferase